MGSLDEGDVSQRSAERASAVNGHDVLRLAERDLSGGHMSINVLVLLADVM